MSARQTKVKEWQQQTSFVLAAQCGFAAEAAKCYRRTEVSPGRASPELRNPPSLAMRLSHCFSKRHFEAQSHYSFAALQNQVELGMEP